MIDSYILTKSALNEVHKHSFRNKTEVQGSQVCHCFHCKEQFPSSEVLEWTDEDETALCPKCGIDAVMGDASGVEMTPALLRAMNEFWFERLFYPKDFDFGWFTPLKA